MKTLKVTSEKTVLLINNSDKGPESWISCIIRQYYNKSLRPRTIYTGHFKGIVAYNKIPQIPNKSSLLKKQYYLSITLRRGLKAEFHALFGNITTKASALTQFILVTLRASAHTTKSLRAQRVFRGIFANVKKYKFASEKTVLFINNCDKGL